MAFDTCVENSSGAVLKAVAASTPKCRSHDDPRPPIPAGIQDEKPEELAAEAVTEHQIPRSESRRQLPAEVGGPPAHRGETRPVECDSRIPRFRRPITVEDDQTPSPPGHPGGNRSLRL